MREACTDCALKHIAQAHILLHEARLGYPDHVYLAMGHLAEASDELSGGHIEMARELRAVRKRIEEEEDADFNVLEWIRKIVALDDVMEAEVEDDISPEDADMQSSARLGHDIIQRAYRAHMADTADRDDDISPD